MDPIERAIRNGFTRGDPSDPAFREKVYRSAFAALDRALQANSDTTVERAIVRRRELQNKVKEIEAEFLAPPVPEVSTSDRAAPLSAERGGRTNGAAPAVSVDPGRPTGPARRESRAEPEFDPFGDMAQPDGLTSVVTPEPDVPRAKRRRSWMALATVATIALLGLGGWFLLDAAVLPSGPPDGTPPLTVEDLIAGDEAAGGPLSAATDTRNWIRVFSPDDPSTVSVPEGGQASVETTEGIPFLQIRSGAKGAAVRFDVGQGVLEKLAGRKAVFDIMARAEDGADTQVSIECDFGGYTTCGRKRYDVTAATRADLLFDVEFPQGRPSAGGAILLEPDVASGSKAVNVYEIRVSPSD